MTEREKKEWNGPAKGLSQDIALNELKHTAKIH